MVCALHALLATVALAGMDVCSLPSGNVFTKEELEPLEGPRLLPATAARQKLASELLPAVKALSQLGLGQPLKHLETILPAAAALAADIAQQTGSVVSAALHVGTSGGCSAEPNETLVLQLKDSCDWSFWRPLLHRLDHADSACAPEAAEVAKLARGAVLRLPRDFVHAQRCEASSYLVFSLMPRITPVRVLLDVAKAHNQPEVAQKISAALQKHDGLSMRLQRGLREGALTGVLLLLEELASGLDPALARTMVQQRLQETPWPRSRITRRWWKSGWRSAAQGR
ncbi:unnamed protein product [Effrenium voratum]|uniref:Uncharacterized protein n=1 Tax=Effrenium voratum TaxID=2562239 RepID=A0AA36MQT7_9DINO|nr:unnamed protein product [Effrenium voratum]